jgi:hypothetical protein
MMKSFSWNGGHKLCFDFYIFSLNSTVAFRKAVLRIRVLFRLKDPDPGKKKKSGSGIRDEHPRSFFQSLETVFGVKILKFFDADLDPGSF